MGNIWKSSEISLTLKLRIYQAAVCSVVMYGSEAWIWNEALEKKLKNWNAKRVAFMTEKEIREEYKDPTFDLVARTRKRRPSILRLGVGTSEIKFNRCSRVCEPAPNLYRSLE